MSKLTSTQVHSFRAGATPPASGSPDSGPFVNAGTGSGVIYTPDGGALKLGFDNSNEAARKVIYGDDHLGYDIDDLVRVEFLIKITSVASTSNVTVGFGMCSAYNATLDSMTEQAMMRVEGGSDNLLCESDDGTNDNNDVDSGEDISGDWQRFAIDFGRGVLTQSPPSLSKGGKANVHYYAGNAEGSLRRLASSTGFDMSNYSGGLQPFVQIEKASSTDTGSLWIREICITTKDN